MGREKREGRGSREGGIEERREIWYSWWHRSAELKGTCATQTPLLSAVCCVVVAAAAVVIVVDLIVLWCATPPWYEGDIFLFPVSYSSLPQWCLIQMTLGAVWVSGRGRKRAGMFCSARETVRSPGCKLEREHGARTCYYIFSSPKP